MNEKFRHRNQSRPFIEYNFAEYSLATFNRRRVGRRSGDKINVFGCTFVEAKSMDMRNHASDL